MVVHTFILIILALAALWTVMTRSLLRAAIGLALTSAVLTIIMFKLDSPLAAVFELSVCSGLISVLFVSTISLTNPLSQQEVMQHMKDRLLRFWYLPVIVVITGIALVLLKIKFNLTALHVQTDGDVRYVLWNTRNIDLLGQIIILLTGVFGVVILFKEMRKNDK